MKFDAGSSVLFVGEGNFSFTEALSRQKSFVDVTLVASCFQQELTEKASLNVQSLQERGVEVVVGVDATKLHMIPNLKNRKFSSVVFNFPHVGGKMKIHLNRNLLYEFFKSVIHILRKDGGQIMVTLCAGQGGGIPVDPVVRRWDDTWKVVQLASRADLVLRKVEKFDASDYFGYSATGYRSLEKGFDQNGALTFIFERCPTELACFNLNAICTKDVLLYNGYYMRIPAFIFSQIKRSLWSDLSTLVGQLYFKITQLMSASVTLYNGKDIFGDENTEIKDVLKFYTFDPLKKLQEMVLLHPLYILKRTQIFKIELLLVFLCIGKYDIETFLSENLTFEMVNLNKSFCPKYKQVIWKDFIDGPYSMSQEDPHSLKMLLSTYAEPPKDVCIFSLNLTQLVRVCFEVDADELWAYGQTVKECHGSVTYSPYSLFPLKYVYDLSFWQSPINCINTSSCENNHSLCSSEQSESQICLDLDSVGIIITNIAKDMLIDYELLSTYIHPETSRRSFTFRIRYRSFYGSLSDCKAKQIHSEIGFKLTEYLGVEIR